MQTRRTVRNGLVSASKNRSVFCLEWLWRLKSNFAKLLLNLRGDFAKSISFPARSYKIVK